MKYYHNLEICECKNNKIAYDCVSTNEHEADQKSDQLEKQIEKVDPFSINIMPDYVENNNNNTKDVKAKSILAKNATFYHDSKKFLAKIKAWQPILTPPSTIRALKQEQPILNHETKQMHKYARLTDKRANPVQYRYKKNILNTFASYLKSRHMKHHMNTITNCLDKIQWYDAGYDINRLIFQTYSTLTTKQHNKKCALLARRYQKGTKNTFDLVDKSGHEHEYHLAQEPSIMQFLWQNNIARIVIIIWLQCFAHIKSHHANEEQNGSAKECRQADRIINLLYGYRSSNGMHLNGYHRNHKETLSKQQWKHKWYKACNNLYNLWD